jgi:ankyrin repeat protein
MRKFMWALLAVLPFASPAAQTPKPRPAAATVDYARDVKPILSQNCYACHGPEAQQSGLRLDLRQNALRGGDYGPVIIPGKSAESRLIRRLVDGDGGLQMPPSGPLSSEEIGILRAWVDQGAEFRTEVDADLPAKATEPKLAALIAAVRSQPRASVEPLVAADPTVVAATDAGGSTLLHHAAGFGRLETLALLIDWGAEIDARNRRRSTPLHWAIHDEAKVRLLLSRGAAVNARQVEGRTPLFQAAVLGNGLSTIRFLLQTGADANIGLANGRTPLMAASSRGDVEALGSLLDAGADVNARDGAGETALMLAAADGRPETVRLLLDRGADPLVRTKRNETALGFASTVGEDDTVRLLLERGAKVNVRNIRGYSPLMLAAGSDAVPAGTVKMLLAHGADTGFAGDYEETALDLAAKRGDTALSRLLGGAPASRGTSSTAASDVPTPNRMRTIPDAVEQALAMVEKQSDTFIRTAGCNSCHSQDLPSAATGFARSRGLRVPGAIPQLPQSMMPAPERIIDLSIVSAAGTSWELVDFGMNGVPRSEYTDAAVRTIKAMQTAQGHWSASESRRPPMNAGDFQAAAVAIYAIKHYTPPGDEASSEQAIARAVAWLEQSEPETTQDRAFKAIAIGWARDGSESARHAASSLVAVQRSDGGWSQLPGLESDAYATGQALYALFLAGQMPATDPVYQRGVNYLLRTQAADGTWHVRSRAIWLQPYFESGFPYGRDQFISTAGTAWAVMALAAATPSPTATAGR